MIQSGVDKTREALNAFLLHAAEAAMERIYGHRKRAIYKGLPDTVVEIGPGTGANMRYYSKHTRLIAVEPNAAMFPHLLAKARSRSIDLFIQAGRAERIQLPDASVSAVVGTLVLCSVENPNQVISEICRILMPGGRYLFLEHVAAMTGTRLRGVQELLLPVWRRLFDGCHLNRDTHRLIAEAGFRSVAMDCFSMKNRWLPFAPHIFGVAFK